MCGMLVEIRRIYEYENSVYIYIYRLLLVEKRIKMAWKKFINVISKYEDAHVLCLVSLI